MEEYYDYFEMKEFYYKDKNSGLKFVFYARTEEIATRLKDLFNSVQDDCFLVKSKFRYKKPFFVNIPPYELEQAQEEYIYEMDEKYRKRKEEQEQ